MFPELRSNQSCWQGTAGTVGRGRLAAPLRAHPSAAREEAAAQLTLERLRVRLELVTSVFHQGHPLILSMSKTLCPDTGCGPDELWPV